MRINRVDKYHTLAVRCYRILGASVQEMTKQKDGCPDILVGYRGVDGTIEIKTGKRKLGELQIHWHRNWKGKPVIVVSFPEDSTNDEVMSLCKSTLEIWR